VEEAIALGALGVLGVLEAQIVLGALIVMNVFY